MLFHKQIINGYPCTPLIRTRQISVRLDLPCLGKPLSLQINEQVNSQALFCQCNVWRNCSLWLQGWQCQDNFKCYTAFVERRLRSSLSVLGSEKAWIQGPAFEWKKATRELQFFWFNFHGVATGFASKRATYAGGPKYKTITSCSLHVCFPDTKWHVKYRRYFETRDQKGARTQINTAPSWPWRPQQQKIKKKKPMRATLLMATCCPIRVGAQQSICTNLTQPISKSKAKEAILFGFFNERQA